MMLESTESHVNVNMKRPAEVDRGTCAELINEYAGYEPAPGINLLKERITADMTPAEFFQRYIHQRRPAIFADLLTNHEWSGCRWTANYLFTKAANMKVTVEDHNSSESPRPLNEMSYKDFVAGINAGESRYHLAPRDEQSNSYNLRDREAMLSTVVPPLQALAGDFPLRPSLGGNLVLHKVALCQGHVGVKSGLSDKLQHYFHDTLHLVVSGRRRFRLFPPAAVSALCSPRCKFRIHPNGLIVYLPTEPSKQPGIDVRADGAPLIVVARQKRDDAERDLIDAEDKLYRLREAGADEISEMKEQLEMATAAVRECERLVDIAADELDTYYSDDDVISIHDDDSDPELCEEPPAKVPKVSEEETETDTASELYHFNYFDVRLAVEDTDDPEVLYAECPSLKDVGCLVADLKAGESLFLPASWLCQVTTFDGDVDQQEDSPQCLTAKPDSSEQMKTVSEAGRSVNTTNTDTPSAISTDSAAECNIPKATMGSDVSFIPTTASDTPSLTETDDKCVTVGAAATKQECSSQVNDEKQLESIERTSEGILEKLDTPVDAVEVAARVAAEVKDEPHIAETGSANTTSQSADRNKGPTADTQTVSNGGINVTTPSYLAINYWWHPPDGDSFEQPYRHNFWSRRWLRNESELRRMLWKSSRSDSDVISVNSNSSSDCESSDYEESEEYDSDHNNSPIFLAEKRSSSSVDVVNACDNLPKHSSYPMRQQIVLDEGSNSAIVVGDDSESDAEPADDVEWDDEAMSVSQSAGSAGTSLLVCDSEKSFVAQSQLSHAVRSQSCNNAEVIDDVEMTGPCKENGDIVVLADDVSDAGDGTRQSVMSEAGDGTRKSVDDAVCEMTAAVISQPLVDNSVDGNRICGSSATNGGEGSSSKLTSVESQVAAADVDSSSITKIVEGAASLVDEGIAAERGCGGV